jgi:hypothetical protein
VTDYLLLERLEPWHRRRAVGCKNRLVLKTGVGLPRGSDVAFVNAFLKDSVRWHGPNCWLTAIETYENQRSGAATIPLTDP